MAKARRRPKRQPSGRTARLAASATDRHLPEQTAVTPRSPLAIVAIGASAGGLEAFTQILDKLPDHPNAALIFIQHLSPQHESALPELLAAHSRQPVVQAQNDMPIEPNRVYVMPPNVQLEIAGDRLHMRPRPHGKTQFTPIDVFFESLAQDAQERAIAIILSGTASDGSHGIRDVKALGGITIAQKPESAKFDSMPRAAIATGLVDLILTPGEIAQHIGGLRHHPYLAADRAPTSTSQPQATGEELRELFTALRRSCGIDFQQYKSPTIMRRLLRRMALARVTTLDAYLRHIREHPSEASALCQDLLIHVTRFFREPDSFKAIASILPEVVPEHPKDPIRIWVPGCATGEEAYSVAMLVMEFLGNRIAERKLQVFATDVSETAIEHARTGIFPASIAGDVSPDRLRRFFTKADGSFRVSKALRDACVFAKHDLTNDPPFSRLDLIVCRNVLIYLGAALQNRLITVFHYALRSQGFLMLGPAETPGAQRVFTIVNKRWRIYRKLATDPGIALAFPPVTHMADRPRHTEPPSQNGAAAPKPMQEDVNRIVLEKYAPPGVVVDANDNIVQFRGRTGPYLEAASGEPNLNLLKMARGGLLHSLRSALQAARRKKQPVRKDGVLIERNRDWRAIDLEVVPLTSMRGDFLLVLFEPSPHKPAPHGKKGSRKLAATRAADGRVSDLRRELIANREYLQSIIQELEAANEELQSANEEILSSNEELQSTNEELDTAKEELQSTNEELNTVNEELHSRNDELGRVNSDLVNLLASVDFPIVIVSSDLAIRRFTPMAEQIFNLIPGDIGRPIGQIKSNLQIENIEALIRQAIDGVTAREQEVQDQHGRWFSLRVRPYKALDNRLDGAVIAAIDIDSTRRHQRVVQRAREYIMAIVETVRHPLLVLDSDLRIQKANDAFLKRFGADRSIPGLARLIEHVTSGERPAEDMNLEHDFPAIGRRRVVINARRLELDDAKPWILVAIEDVSGAAEDQA